MSHPCSLNDKAVDLIEAGQYSEAVSTLTKALKVVKLVVSGDAMIRPDLEDDEDGQEETSFFCEFVCSRKSSFQLTQEKSGIESSTIFRDPICIGGKLPRAELEKCEVITYVLLYNLALSYHLTAMTEEEEHIKVAYLTKSLALYEHAHHMLSNQQLEVPLLHTMAIASNLGHIHHVIGDEEKAHSCFQYLLSTILYVVDCGEAGKNDILDGFFCNVMPLIGSVSSAPAA